MKVNKYGRSYQKGKALPDEFRSMIIDAIVENGGDMVTGYFPGSFDEIAKRFKLNVDTVQRIWKTFYTTGEFKRPKPSSSGVKHLMSDDLEFIKFLKTNQPSMTTGELIKNVNEYCALPIGTSKPAINRAVLNYMQEGKWSWKRMVRPAGEKFTPENIQYCQEFLNYISTIDPHRLKFFDESGVKLPDVANPSYGHSLVGTPCVEIMRNAQSPNITLNLLCGANGLMYANTVKGASNTVNFLRFFDEASLCFQPDGRAVLEYGDHVILDNCATHRYLGGQILGEWLDDVGCVLLYLPSYSPELNPAEFVFNKLKTILKRNAYRELLRDNLHLGVLEGLKQVTAADMRGFYEHTGYIHFT